MDSSCKATGKKPKKQGTRSLPNRERERVLYQNIMFYGRLRPFDFSLSRRTE